MAFLITPCVVFCLISLSSSSSPPVIIEHPQDWSEDAAFSEINITRTAPGGSARFSCRATGSPAPSISWFAAGNRSEEFRQVKANSSQFHLLDTDLLVLTPQVTKPWVFCEAASPMGRVRSRPATFRQRGRLNPMVLSYMRPKWISKTHALVICADRQDYVTEEPTIEGATIHKVQPWGDVYSYGAYYDDHSGTSNTQEFLSASGRSDVYWNGAFIVISTNVTHYKNVLNLFFCQQIWQPHFIAGTQQEPEDYLHGVKKYPATKGRYTRYPFLQKRIYTHDNKPNEDKLPEVSVRIFSPNSEGFIIGRNVTLDCLTLSLDPGLITTWFRGSSPIGLSPKSRVRSEPIAFFGQRLLIASLRDTDSGNYTCVVSKGTANHSATIPVEPQLPLDLALQPPSGDVNKVLQEGSRVELECRYRTAASSRPRELLWLFNGSAARGHRSSGPGWSRLSVTELEAGHDDGCFQCVLREPSGAFAVRTAACLRLTPAPGASRPVITVTTGARVHPNGSLAGPPILVTVTDEDVGRGGRIASCNLRSANSTQPLPADLSIRNFAAFQLKALKLPEEQDSVLLECLDRSQPPLHASILVTVERCRVQCPRRPFRGDGGFASRLIRLLGRALNEAEADRWLADLARLTKEARRNGVATADFDLFLTVLRTAVRSPAVAFRLDRVLEDLNRLLLAPKPDLGSNSARDRRLSLKVLNLTDAIVAALPTPRAAGNSTVLRSELLSVAVLKLLPRKDRPPGAVAQFLVPAGGDPPAAFAASTVGAAIPRGSFGIALSQAAVRGDRVEFALAPHNFQLFKALRGRPRAGAKTQVPESPIVSAAADLTHLENSNEEPVTFSLRPLNPALQNEVACAFWDFRANTWSSRGCRKVEASGGLVSCRCSHLTNFALLLDVDRATSMPSWHQLVLSVLSYALLTLSALFLLLTVLIYGCFLRRETRRMSSGHSSSSRESRITASRVLLSLCVALLLATLVFLAGSHYNRAGGLCTLVGVLLHYFYLAVFFWSVVEAAHICVTVVYVSLKSNQISIHISHFFLKASAFAWGLPLIIVAVTVGVNRTANYGTDLGADYRFCFLASGAFFAAFLGPMLLCLAGNITILILLALVLRRYAFASKAKGPGEKKSQWRQHLVGFIGICFILNVTWIIGALQVGAAKLPLQYLHVLVNGLQGVFIFVFYCLLRSDIRSFMQKRVRRALGIEEKPTITSRTATSEANSMMTSGERRLHLTDTNSSAATKTELLSATSVVNEPRGASPDRDKKEAAGKSEADGLLGLGGGQKAEPQMVV